LNYDDLRLPLAINVKAEGHKLTNPEILENERPVDFEIDEGVKQTPSGHLLISNSFKPVLSCEE